MHGRRKEFFQGGGTSGFFQKYFYGGPKQVKFVFYHSKLRKQHICWNCQIPAPLRTPIYLCVGKVCTKQLKNMGNFKRFNTIPNKEILLNLIRKMKYLTDQFFNCVFVFALATLNSCILSLHWQHNWHSYGQLAVATCVLSCLCISIHMWRNRLAAWA